MSLLLNMLSSLVTASFPRSKCLLISWLQSLSAVALEPKKMKSDTCGQMIPLFPFHLPWSDGARCHDRSLLSLGYAFYILFNRSPCFLQRKATYIDKSCFPGSLQTESQEEGEQKAVVRQHPWERTWEGFDKKSRLGRHPGKEPEGSQHPACWRASADTSCRGAVPPGWHAGLGRLGWLHPEGAPGPARPPLMSPWVPALTSPAWPRALWDARLAAGSRASGGTRPGCPHLLDKFPVRGESGCHPTKEERAKDFWAPLGREALSSRIQWFFIFFSAACSVSSGEE